MGLAVHPKEDQTLDFEKTYPCPSCRQGLLVPITLTEAWGCSYCEQIFERREEPGTIGKLATPSHRRRSWRWDGKQWVMGSKLAKPKTINTYALMALLAGLLWFGLTHSSLPGLLIAGITALVLFLVVMLWLSRRR
ncbi:MAG: hypothetical protein WA885_09540 [Phormidesmis sp.]